MADVDTSVPLEQKEEAIAELVSGTDVVVTKTDTLTEDEPLQNDEPSKHAGGRPLKYETPAKLDMAIQGYFDECDPHIINHMEATGMNERGETMFKNRSIMSQQRPYTMSGLARAIGLTRQSLLNYKDRDEFFDSIEGAKQRCEEYAEGQLFGPYSNGAKFSLINNYRGKHQDWADKHEVDHTSDSKPIPLLAGLVATGPLVIEDDEDGGTASADDSSHEDKQS